MIVKTFCKRTDANVIFSDFPDPDVICVDNVYYMASTTMHFMPGCVILRSYNLADWEFCAYVYDELEKNEKRTLSDNRGIYGKGMWAPSLRYDGGVFYVAFSSNDARKTYLFRSEKITGVWKRSEIQGFYHDMSLLFDYDKSGGRRIFAVHGNCDVYLTELNSDLSAAKENGVNKIIIRDDKEKVDLGYEGSHFYKINGKYYVFCIHKVKNQMRSQACFYSDNIEGPYKGGEVFCADYKNWNSGAAQGGIVRTADGNWFAMLFQDHGALGRVPILVPVDFSSDFPVFKKDFCQNSKIKNQNDSVIEKISVPDNNPGYVYKKLYGNDFLDENGNLNYFWQWNHIRDAKLAKIQNFGGKNAFAVKTDKIVKNVVQAANILTQRTFGEKCSACVSLDVSSIKEGDFAGFCALEGEYSFIAATKKNEKLRLVKAEHKIPYSAWTMNVFDDDAPQILEEKEFESQKIRLKIDFDLSKEKQTAEFFYFDEKNGKFAPLGKPSRLRYTLDQFVGARFAMFIYSTIQTGGTAVFYDFEYFFDEGGDEKKTR